MIKKLLLIFTLVTSLVGCGKPNSVTHEGKELYKQVGSSLFMSLDGKSIPVEAVIIKLAGEENDLIEVSFLSTISSNLKQLPKVGNTGEYQISFIADKRGFLQFIGAIKSAAYAVGVYQYYADAYEAGGFYGEINFAVNMKRTKLERLVATSTNNGYVGFSTSKWELDNHRTYVAIATSGAVDLHNMLRKAVLELTGE